MFSNFVVRLKFKSLSVNKTPFVLFQLKTNPNENRFFRHVQKQIGNRFLDRIKKREKADDLNYPPSPFPLPPQKKMDLTNFYKILRGFEWHIQLIFALYFSRKYSDHFFLLPRSISLRLNSRLLEQLIKKKKQKEIYLFMYSRLYLES